VNIILDFRIVGHCIMGVAGRGNLSPSPPLSRSLRKKSKLKKGGHMPNMNKKCYFSKCLFLYLEYSMVII
jgi:hypothetical protein